MKIISTQRERLLLAELAEIRRERAAGRDAGGRPNVGLINYEMGLRTAGHILGVTTFGGESRRWWQTWKARWWR